MLRSTLALLILVFSASASAEDFDYNFLSLGYGTTDFDEINVDGDGFTLSGSYAINNSYHLFGGYNATDLDFNVDATTFSAGFGYNRGLTDAVDLVAGLSYEYIELEGAGGSIDDSGLGIGIGLRIAASEMLELNGGIKHVDFGDGGDDTGFQAGGLYNFNDAFALGLSGNWSDDVSSYALSGRFYFGN